MPTQALACPSCRTWFEASGRSVRCPSCGHKFNAETARLERTAAESVGRRYPASDDSPTWAPVDAAEEEWRPDEDARQETHLSVDHSQPESNGEQPVSQPEAASGRPNLNSLFTIATLALLFVGPRVIEPNFILPILICLIAARWLYSRWARSAGASES